MKLKKSIVRKSVKRALLEDGYKSDLSLKAKNILEIGCANGNKLYQYSKLLNSKNNYGIDLSKKAILNGKLKYKNLNLLNISSLEIDDIKINFDIIIININFFFNNNKIIIFQTIFSSDTININNM